MKCILNVNITNKKGFKSVKPTAYFIYVTMALTNPITFESLDKCHSPLGNNANILITPIWILSFHKVSPVEHD